MKRPFIFGIMCCWSCCIPHNHRLQFAIYLLLIFILATAFLKFICIKNPLFNESLRYVIGKFIQIFFIFYRWHNKWVKEAICHDIESFGKIHLWIQIKRKKNYSKLCWRYRFALYTFKLYRGYIQPTLKMATSRWFIKIYQFVVPVLLFAIQFLLMN